MTTMTGALLLALAAGAVQGAPTASPATGTAPLTVSFSSVPSGGTLYEWDFYYTVTVGFQPSYTSPVGSDVSFTYLAPGTHTARLRVHQLGGGTTDLDIPITVNPDPAAPTATVTPTRVSGNDTEIIYDFQATVTSPQTTVVAYLWDFEGDGEIDVADYGSGAATYSFPNATQAYLVFLTIYDSEGRAGTSITPLQTFGTAGSGFDYPNLAAFSATTDGATVQAGGTLAAKVGHVVSFSADADAGSFGFLTGFFWDFDGNRKQDRIVLSATTPDSSTVLHQFEAPGSYSARVRVLDSEGLSVSSVITVDVVQDPAVFECWIVQPRDTLTVWGDHLTLRAKTVPEIDTASIEFKYRTAGASPFPPPTDPSWVTIDTVTPPPYSFLGVHWDVSGLTQGAAYDLIAVARNTSGVTASSAALQEITVTVSAVNPDVEEFRSSGSTGERVRGIDPNRNEKNGITRDTIVEVPTGSTSGYDVMRIARRAGNPHPLEARLQGLHFIPGHFRTLSFDNSSSFKIPARITMYVSDSDQDGIIDGSVLEKATLKIYRWEPTRTQWEPLFAGLVQPDEDLVNGLTASTGEIGLVAEYAPRAPSTKSSSCGSTGWEGLLALWGLLLLPRFRRAG